ncbi:centrosomal protein of 152 kDa-like isoform X2 [Limulus polyphemus]|uniref:Centrosomal protein of 152 kDa-like isoform X2 n=1 Tax=Limulus polyphemus TaxID=6850 RepID=A0ABM1T577_LIMPO|nr:centrosomal protein of 152 kDa-like isoform X2 [Limulus polyphemus]
MKEILTCMKKLITLEEMVQEKKEVAHLVMGTNSNFCQVKENELLQLQILYKARSRELQQVTSELEQFKEDASREIRILKHQITLLQGDKEGLSFSLQQAQQLLADKEEENRSLEGIKIAQETQLENENQAKQELIRKLQVQESTIDSLQQQLADLGRSESLVRAREQHDSVLNTLKQRHMEETLELKEEVDKCKHQLEAQTEKAVILQQKLDDQGRIYEKTILEKAETITRLTMNLKTSQQQCQELLESGTVQELSRLKNQLKLVEEEKDNLEKKLKDAMEELNNLKVEVENYESLSRLGVFSGSGLDGAEDSIIQLGLIKRPGKSLQNRDDVLTNLKAELERCLTNVRTRRLQAANLQTELTQAAKEVNRWQERAESAEQKAAKAEEKIPMLERRLEELCPNGSVPLGQHQKMVKDLQEQKDGLERELEELKDRLQYVCHSEEQLTEMNQQLKNQMSQMLIDHDEDKQEAVMRCRDEYSQRHHDSVQKLEQQLIKMAENEKEKLQQEYEGKIKELTNHIRDLATALDDVKNLYVKVCHEKEFVENQVLDLQEKLQKANQEKGFSEDSQPNEKWKVMLQNAKEEWLKEAEKVYTKRLETELAKSEEKWNGEYKETWQRIKIEEEEVALRKKLEEELHMQYEQEKQKAVEEVQLEYETKWTHCKYNLQHLYEARVEEIVHQNAKFLTGKVAEIQAEMEKKQNSNCDKDVQTDLTTDSDHGRNRELITIEKELLKFQNIEKDLKEKIKKYQKRLLSSEKKHEGEIKKLKEEFSKVVVCLKKKVIELQSQNEIKIEARTEEVKKQHFSVRDEIQYESEKKQMIRKLDDKESQTEQRRTLDPIAVKEKCLEVVQKIFGEFSDYITESNHRMAVRLQRTLMIYHYHLISKLAATAGLNSHVSELQPFPAQLAKVYESTSEIKNLLPSTKFVASVKTVECGNGQKSKVMVCNSREPVDKSGASEANTSYSSPPQYHSPQSIIQEAIKSLDDDGKGTKYKNFLKGIQK